MNALNGLRDAVMQSTTVYRKGEVVKRDGIAVSIDAFPSRPDGEEPVDLHFIWVQTNEGTDAERLRTLLDQAIKETGYTDFDGGPSYISVGAWLGDQTLAMQLMGLGERLGWWKVITPKRMGLPKDMWDGAAGRGWVMVTPPKQGGSHEEER